MNTKPILTIASPEDALCLIPHILGYQPTHHLVYFALDTPRGMGPAIAFDTSPGIDPRLGEEIIGVMQRFPAHAALFALYVPDIDDYCASSESDVIHGILADIAHFARREGEADTYYAAFAVDAVSFIRLDMREGVKKPRSALHHVEKHIAGVLGKSAPTREAPSLELPAVSPSAMERAACTAAAYAQSARSTSNPGEGIAAFARLRKLAGAMSAAELAEAYPEVCGAASESLKDVAVRDEVLGAVLGASMWGSSFYRASRKEDMHGILHSEEPPTQRVNALLDACRAISALRPEDSAALVLGAYVAWWKGWGSLSGAFLSEAQRRGNHSRMAELVGCALAGHVPPPWAAVRGERPKAAA